MPAPGSHVAQPEDSISACSSTVRVHAAACPVGNRACAGRASPAGGELASAREFDSMEIMMAINSFGPADTFLTYLKWVHDRTAVTVLR